MQGNVILGSESKFGEFKSYHSIFVSRLKRETGETSRDTFEILSLSRDTLSRMVRRKFVPCLAIRSRKSSMSRDTNRFLFLSRDTLSRVSQRARRYYAMPI